MTELSAIVETCDDADVLVRVQAGGPGRASAETDGRRSCRMIASEEIVALAAGPWSQAG